MKYLVLFVLALVTQAAFANGYWPDCNAGVNGASIQFSRELDPTSTSPAYKNYTRINGAAMPATHADALITQGADQTAYLTGCLYTLKPSGSTDKQRLDFNFYSKGVFTGNFLNHIPVFVHFCDQNFGNPGQISTGPATPCPYTSDPIPGVGLFFDGNPGPLNSGNALGAVVDESRLGQTVWTNSANSNFVVKDGASYHVTIISNGVKNHIEIRDTVKGSLLYTRTVSYDATKAAPQIEFSGLAFSLLCNSSTGCNPAVGSSQYESTYVAQFSNIQMKWLTASDWAPF